MQRTQCFEKQKHDESQILTETREEELEEEKKNGVNIANVFIFQLRSSCMLQGNS